MKKKKLLSTLGALFILVVAISALTFTVVKQNMQNEVIRIALVNEDNGVVRHEEQINYGRDLFTHLSNSKKVTYETTSRTAALKGLEEGKYDMAIIAPYTFSANISSYDSPVQVTASLEYELAPNLSQVQYLNSINILNSIKADLNSAVIAMYTAEIMSVIQEMQAQSSAILEAQMLYQDDFDRNVTNPVNRSVDEFSNLLSSVDSNQSRVENFGTQVNSFDSQTNSVIRLQENQLKSISDFSVDNTFNINSANALAQSVDPLLAQVNSDNVGTLANLESILTEDQISLLAIINNMKVSALNLEIRIKQMEDYKRVNLDYAVNIYSQIEAILRLQIESGGTPEFDVNNLNLAGIPEADHAAFKEQAQQIYDSLINTSDSITSRIFDGDTFQNELFDAFEIEQPRKIKDAIERSFEIACNALPSQINNLPAGIQRIDYDKTVEFCTESRFEMNTDSPVQSDPLYYSTSVPHDYILQPTADLLITIPAHTGDLTITVVDKTTGQEFYNGEYFGPISVQNSSAQDYELEITVSIVKEFDYLDVLNSPIPSQHPDFEPVEILLSEQLVDEFGEIVEGYPVDTSFNVLALVYFGGISSGQQLALDSFLSIDALARLYYGLSIKELLEAPIADEPLYSDALLDLSSGIKQFRLRVHGQEALIVKLEKSVGRLDLELEFAANIAAIYAEILMEQAIVYNEYLVGLQQFSYNSLNISSIYNEDGTLVTIDLEMLLSNPELYHNPGTGKFNATIEALLLKENTILTAIAEYAVFYNNFQTVYLPGITDLHQAGLELVVDMEELQQFSISLSETQQDLLKGLFNLSDTIQLQLLQVSEINEDAAQLIERAEAMETQVNTYRTLVADSKLLFDSITDLNSEYVDGFISQYTASRLGGQDNESFYDHIAEPVKIDSTQARENETLIPFFTIILINVFALISGYFFSTFKLKAVAETEYEHPSIITALKRNLVLVVLSAVLMGAIIAYVGLQSLQFANTTAFMWTSLIVAMTLVLTLLYYALILRFRTLGMMVIGVMMMIYFLTNGALGMALIESKVFLYLHILNPLTSFESPLTSIISTNSFNVLPTIATLLITLITSAVTIFAFHPKSE